MTQLAKQVLRMAVLVIYSDISMTVQITQSDARMTVLVT